MTIKPIGIVRNGVKGIPAGRHGDWWVGLVSEIVIDSTLADALDGLEAFSHIIVLYWMHRIGSREVHLKIHPRDRAEAPLTGLFATRIQYRPNPVGKMTVRLLQRRGNILRVEGLDALDGTPVIDIKPYIPGYDSKDDAKAPHG